MRVKSLIALSLLLTASNAVLADSSERDLKCLALNVYHEARGEPLEGQLAVAMVTMNRVYSKSYPDTVCGVVWQRRQFSWTHDGRSDRPRDQQSWKVAKQISEYVYNKYDKHRDLSGGALDLTKGALHYYAPKHANPNWANYKEVTSKIGGHIFLKGRKNNRS
ncbi:MAG: cell wall hydrolase [Gammaproteobacteria bacterium]|nr:cell wall hydrolase [Gammaproteobacteria bacterium]MDH5691920.1 cell wall hydrolase [Gammaproteobacteria bacterium]